MFLLLKLPDLDLEVRERVEKCASHDTIFTNAFLRLERRF